VNESENHQTSALQSTPITQQRHVTWPRPFWKKSITN